MQLAAMKVENPHQETTLSDTCLNGFQFYSLLCSKWAEIYVGFIFHGLFYSLKGCSLLLSNPLPVSDNAADQWVLQNGWNDWLSLSYTSSLQGSISFIKHKVKHM